MVIGKAWSSWYVNYDKLSLVNSCLTQTALGSLTGLPSVFLNNSTVLTCFLQYLQDLWMKSTKLKLCMYLFRSALCLCSFWRHAYNSWKTFWFSSCGFIFPSHFSTSFYAILSHMTSRNNVYLIDKLQMFLILHSNHGFFSCLFMPSRE